jgi:protein ImuB
LFRLRRVLALVFPDLACGLAGGGGVSGLGVVLGSPEGGEAGAEVADGKAIVWAVDMQARARGVRPGMRVSEAMARAAGLGFAEVAPSALVGALGAAAEIALGFGTPVEVSWPDTVFVDVTGSAHLFGGEEALADALVARASTLLEVPISVGVAIADGPFVARALARERGRGSAHASASSLDAASTVGPLPVAVLDAELAARSVPNAEWTPPSEREAPSIATTFAGFGVRTLGALAALDRAQLAARLAPLVGPVVGLGRVAEVLRWIDGVDPRPLVPFEPAAVLVDRMTFEDGVETSQQLIFALRGMLSRLSARLTGRRQATSRIDVTLHYDRSILRLTEAPRRGLDALAEQAPEDRLTTLLPAPLAYTEELFRATKAKLEARALRAPCVAVEVTLSRIVAAPVVQLDLARDVRVHPEALPALLSELSAELGEERVGTLVTVDDHRPERRSRLEWGPSSESSAVGAKRRRRAARRASPSAEQLRLFGPEPTRVLPAPLRLAGPPREGERLMVDGEAFVVRKVEFDRRIDAVTWWTEDSPSRDYLAVELAAARAQERRGVEPPSTVAWVFVDRRTGETFLHGFWE